ncbi:hypothetical protein B566_EDAN014939 [Ephemera danica]|nr:hypothetical protein B566_EDAN014939 [Ephemera danica]
MQQLNEALISTPTKTYNDCCESKDNQSSLPSPLQPFDITLGVSPLPESPSARCASEETGPADFDSLPLRPTLPPPKEPAILTGRRIVDIVFFFEQIKEISAHKLFGCGFREMIFVCEIQLGFRSCIQFKCGMCNETFKIWTENCDDKTKMDVNSAMTQAALSNGGAFEYVSKTAGSLNMPCYSPSTYKLYFDVLAAGLNEAAIHEMNIAGQREYELAVQANEISPDGVSYITVVVDGSWLRRSYKGYFASLLGAGVIVGFRTGLILFIGCRCKFCIICHRAYIKGEEPNVHSCIKNWGRDQSSSSMESDIIAQGFLQSESVHKLRYKTVVGDGDSSTYKKLLEVNPYPGIKIEKIECKNHLYRNFCNKLRALVTSKAKVVDSRNKTVSKYPITLRKVIGGRVLKLRRSITAAVSQIKGEFQHVDRQTMELRKEISTCVHHVFGDHQHCKSTCTPEPDENNYVPDMKACGLWGAISEPMNRLQLNSRSLLIDVDNSIVEARNSVSTVFVNGKRILYSKSYATRLNCTVVQFNTGKLQYNLHKTMYHGKSPGIYTKKLEMARTKSNRREKSDVQKNAQNPDYGPNAHTPPLEGIDLEAACADKLASLKMTTNEISRLETATRGQAESDVWHSRRRDSLTASMFGSVNSMQAPTKCDSVINQKLYTNLEDNVAVIHGKTHESTAITCLSLELDIVIEPAGFFVDHTYNFLGATPDGLVGNDTMVEVKCPYGSRYLSPEDAVLQRKCTFWKLNSDGTIGEVNTKHKWYAQVQGAMHISNRNKCIFAIWTPIPPYLKIAYISRDLKFWQLMESKLVKFYLNCLLPELVDPMRPRKLPIRNPEYILQAIAKRKKKIEKNLEEINARQNQQKQRNKRKT